MELERYSVKEKKTLITLLRNNIQEVLFILNLFKCLSTYLCGPRENYLKLLNVIRNV